MSQLSHLQTQLTAHIRNPAIVQAPQGVEPRRVAIYKDLFYNNIEGFISGSFPILRALTDDDCWHEMVRDFIACHRCHTPYFLEISQEFLLYLQNTRQLNPKDYPFMMELAHYEWVELALDISDIDISEIDVDRDADLLEYHPVVSPLAWSLAYQFPVHQIGSEFLPDKPEQELTYLIVYRNRQDNVKFMHANAVTARLLELLQSDDAISGRQALTQLAAQMQHPQPEHIIASGLEILQRLSSLDIILGVH